MTSRPALPREKHGVSFRGSGHAGLWYEKLAGTWDASWSLKKKSGQKEEAPKLSWLLPLTEKAGENGKNVDRKIGDKKLLAEAAKRQARLARARNGRVVELENRSSFVTGIGQAHPVENGFLWHPTLGVPYLPGSGVKGVLRSWLRGGGPEVVAEAVRMDIDPSPRGADPVDDPGTPDEAEIDRLFGTAKEAGAIDFLSMLPTRPLKVQADVVNPHRKDDFGDWNDPVPSFFLSVRSSARWQLAVLPTDREGEDADVLERIEAWILQAADWAGFGAKTSAGYGRFRATKRRKKGKSAR